MKLIYLTFQEDATLYVGVTRKIAWQAHAFEKLGYEVTYSLWKGTDYRFITGEKVETKKVAGGHGIMRQFSEVANDYLTAHQFDVVYMRLDRISFDVVRLCKTARANGASRIIIELPNYPYMMDYIKSVNSVQPLSRRFTSRIKVLGTAAEDRLAGPRLRGLVDAVVLIGNKASSFFGVKAINISNGIDVDAMSAVPPKSRTNEIVIVGVAGTLWWQAYDRILVGMHAYKEKKKPEDPSIRFILVGGDAKEMPEFRALIHQYGLDNDVECPGFKTGAELDEIYARADIGASKLGCYRRGLQACSSLKAREYCAKGLPFLYTCEDSIEEQQVNFALQVPNDSTPVDMNTVVRFVQKCRLNENLGEEERAFARSHFDWQSILKQVLNFAAIKNN
jgi:glycosyltransferase involved in cell wall biosynthesis